MLSTNLALPPQGAPPYYRGRIPSPQSADRINLFNNPNRQTFPSASSSLSTGLRNQIGYRTYTQFMMDFGRNIKPAGTRFTPLSMASPDCPIHYESTAGGEFRFPPREQPTHAARRALIAAMQIIYKKNAAIPSLAHRDWVSVVTFDTTDGVKPSVAQALTGDYAEAMTACTNIQAVGDKGTSTSTEAGMIVARQHLLPKKHGGKGRENTNKVVVLLTDGVPNEYQTPDAQIDKYILKNPSGDFYANGAYWLDGPVMQAAIMQADDWQVYPVGVGLGCDYDFMDRMARTGGTAKGGASPRGSGNPAEYEQVLTKIFEEIINSPKLRLVQ